MILTKKGSSKRKAQMKQKQISKHYVEARRCQSIGDRVTAIIDGVPEKVIIERFGPAPNITVSLPNKTDNKFQVPISDIKL